MGYLFISYNKNDKVQADYLRELLIKKNIDVWMAPYDIAPGSIYAEEIVKAIKGCCALVLLLSNDSQKSQHVGKELNKAVDLDKKIYAIQLEDVTLSDSFDYYLCDHQIINIYKNDFNDENIFERFIKFLDKSVFKINDSAANVKSTNIEADNIVRLESNAEKVVNEIIEKNNIVISGNEDCSYLPLSLLNTISIADNFRKNEVIAVERTAKINEVFKKFSVDAEVISYTVGPSVTRYDVSIGLNASVKLISKYINDISISLGGLQIRFEPIIAGKSTSGFEISNEIITNVELKECISNLPKDNKSLLDIPFGKSIDGALVHASLKEFPHMLIAGVAGSGKSTFLHSMILTLIMRNKPEELKLMLIDPKKFEMSSYNNIPHLICPVVSDTKIANKFLKKLVEEMENRYYLFQKNAVRNIDGFNELAVKNNFKRLPYIVVFIDEYAELVEQVKEVRETILKLAQKARAAGIHLVISTQRPTVNVIYGALKANLTTRVAFLSGSATDSLTIIGEGGAEKFLGNGEMLIDCPLLSRFSKPRIKGCFVDENEINRVCKFLTDHHLPEYDNSYFSVTEEEYQKIKVQIMKQEFCSVSYIQQAFSVDFPTAGIIFKNLISEGIVKDNGSYSKESKVLFHSVSEKEFADLEEYFSSSNHKNEGGNK